MVVHNKIELKIKTVYARMGTMKIWLRKSVKHVVHYMEKIVLNVMSPSVFKVVVINVEIVKLVIWILA